MNKQITTDSLISAVPVHPVITEFTAGLDPNVNIQQRRILQRASEALDIAKVQLGIDESKLDILRHNAFTIFSVLPERWEPVEGRVRELLIGEFHNILPERAVSDTNNILSPAPRKHFVLVLFLKYGWRMGGAKSEDKHEHRSERIELELSSASFPALRSGEVPDLAFLRPPKISQSAQPAALLAELKDFATALSKFHQRHEKWMTKVVNYLRTHEPTTLDERQEWADVVNDLLIHLQLRLKSPRQTPALLALNRGASAKGTYQFQPTGSSLGGFSSDAPVEIVSTKTVPAATKRQRK